MPKKHINTHIYRAGLVLAILLCAAGCNSKHNSGQQSSTQAQATPTPTVSTTPSGTQVSVTPIPTPSPTPTPLSIGAVTRHAADFAGKTVTVQGYMLKQLGGYVIVSDEDSGALGYYDLPVHGPRTQLIQPRKVYILTGVFTNGGLEALNNNPYHLELTQEAVEAPKPTPTRK